MSARAALALAAAALGIAAVVFVYPLAIDAVLDRFGVRAVALAMTGLALATVPLRSRAPGAGPVVGIGIAAVLLAAAIGEERGFLRLVPAWIYWGLAGTCAASVRAPRSLIEAGARWMVPEAPDFIAGYCRVITAAWAVFFAVCGVVIAWLAFAGSPAAWREFTGRDVWIAVAALSVAEFFVRKTWFRYYYRGGPFERLWSTLFPAERTARGRRSLEYIRRYKATLRETEGLAGD